jgi:hypothetical protein
MGKRFNEVAKRYMGAHDVRTINPDKVISELMPLVRLGMAIEGPHIQELEELAIKMIREDFDMDEDVVEIRAKLTPNISLEGTVKTQHQLTMIWILKP